MIVPERPRPCGYQRNDKVPLFERCRESVLEYDGHRTVTCDDDLETPVADVNDPSVHSRPSAD